MSSQYNGFLSTLQYCLFSNFFNIWAIKKSSFRYVYKVCPYKQASQEESHTTTRLGLVSLTYILPYISRFPGSFCVYIFWGDILGKLEEGSKQYYLGIICCLFLSVSAIFFNLLLLVLPPGRSLSETLNAS